MKKTCVRLAVILLLSCVVAPAAIVKGYVRDGESGEGLPGVVVSLEGTDFGDVTRADGYYLIGEVPAGSYTVNFNGVGYASSSRSVLLTGDTIVTLNINLPFSPIEVKPVRVTAERQEFKQDTRVSSLTLTRAVLSRAPALLENDLFRSLQTLPGIVSTSDFSAASFVRGGNADQNLVLIDGVSVYNPTHLGGLFSVLDEDAVKTANLVTGGFPAEYGGRLSSVLDVTTRDGNRNHLRGSLATSLLASRLALEGPVPIGKSTHSGDSADAPSHAGSFSISARRTYFDQLLKLLNYQFPYYFYDVSAKATVAPTADSRVSLAGFVSSDKLDLGVEGNRVFADWGNRLASVNWQHYWTPRISSRTILTYNNYFYDIGLAGGLFAINDTISELGIKSDWTYRLSGDNELKAGLDAGYSRFRYNSGILGYRFNITGEPVTASAYGNLKWKPIPDLILQPGARLDYYIIFKTNENREFWRVSPRFSFKYFINDIFALKGATGRYYQYVSALYPDFSPIPSLFFWVPTFGSYSPQYADHGIFGAERWLDENTNLTLEAYYKRFGLIYQMSGNNNPDSIESKLLDAGNGYSWGADVLLRRDWGKLTGWLSYSLCFARVTFNALTYAPNYDRRHIVNLVLSYPLPKEFNLTARFSFGSGLPYTASVGYYRHWEYGFRRDRVRYDWAEIPSGKNAVRYPDYHRLDLGVERQIAIGNTKLTAQLQIINVYNQKNLLFYYWDYDHTPPLRLAQNQLPILPSLGVKWNF